MWNPFTLTRDLGHARRQANLHKVRAMELQEALTDLLEAVDALPMSVSVPDHPDLRAAVAHRRGVAVKYHALENPLFCDKVDQARRTCTHEIGWYPFGKPDSHACIDCGEPLP